jgi:hypothetical protein
MGRAGKKAFNKCNVRVVEFERFIYDSETEHVVTEDQREPHRDYFLRGYRAILRCPRTEDDGVEVASPYKSHDTQRIALAHLRELAGDLICRDCMYPSMTPVQVSIKRKELAEAEAERLHAYKLVQQARDEIDHLLTPQIHSDVPTTALPSAAPELPPRRATIKTPDRNRVLLLVELPVIATGSASLSN